MSGPDLPPGVRHLHLLGGKGMKYPSPTLPWWKQEWAVHPSFSLGEDNTDSVTLSQPGEAALSPCIVSFPRPFLLPGTPSE